MSTAKGSQAAAPLCLACSSSLPPTKAKLSGSNVSLEIFSTLCCNRPICPSCIASNPRLARYNPCLACLGGVQVVGTESLKGEVKRDESSKRNIDGAIRDEDTYVIGDDDEEPDDDIPNNHSQFSSVNLPPSYSSSSSPQGPLTPPSEPISDDSEPPRGKLEATLAASETIPHPPSKYYIKSGDTLQGIALRFDVDGRELCRLNKLPPSTLSTTPHLLHTRGVLTLPPSAKLSKGIQGGPEGNDEERETQRARERAEKRLQTLTKEVDWRIAKAYVALADDPDEAVEYAVKYKEHGGVISGSGQSNLEVRAVDRYLEDEEWEERERQEVVARQAEHRGGNGSLDCLETYRIFYLDLALVLSAIIFCFHNPFHVLYRLLSGALSSRYLNISTSSVGNFYGAVVPL